MGSPGNQVRSQKGGRGAPASRAAHDVPDRARPGTPTKRAARSRPFGSVLAGGLFVFQIGPEGAHHRQVGTKRGMKLSGGHGRSIVGCIRRRIV